MDRDAALVQDLDLARVDVEAQHVVADFGEAGAGDEADVAGADHRDLHARSSQRCVDGGQRRDGIRRLRDRAPDHEIVGAVGDRGLRRDDPRLVVLRAAGRPDARRDELEPGAERRAQRRRLLTAEQTTPSRPFAARQPREPQRLLRRACRRCPCRARSASPRLVSTVTAISSGFGLPCSAAAASTAARAAASIGAPAGRMDVQHPHAEARGRRAGLRDGVRDVVELEVEKDAKAARDHPAHRLGSGDDEHLLADLERAGRRIEPIGERQRVHRIGEIERDDHARTWELTGRAPSSRSF